MGLGNATIQQWADALMPRIGAQASAVNVANMGAWYECEQSSAQYNIWNTTLNCCGGVPVNSVNVMSYPSLAAGVSATASTLLQSNFMPIVAVFRANGSKVELANAVGSTGWGTNPQCIDSAAAPPGTKGTAGGGTTAAQVSDWAPYVRKSAKDCAGCARLLLGTGQAVAKLTPVFIAPKLVLPQPQDTMWTPHHPLPTQPEAP